ncbi:hypothetical protein A3F66_02315 [candidate division TM6 bacterium RIFCSPHIGHO2_12_FULL_32_22]|nr:MAG: hypothetical protein A3F66_02315 [candidate division TM6 bacterium RIFCSPHIGHO2_12_FULL_32_22]
MNKLLIFLLINFQLNAHFENRFAPSYLDKLLKWLGETTFVANYETRSIPEDCDLLELPEPVKILFSEAQQTFGVAECSKLPVKGFSSENYHTLNYDLNKHAIAVTTPNYLAVNMEFIKQEHPYGAFRQGALHEATHIKYNDPFLKFILHDYSILFLALLIIFIIFLIIFVIISILQLFLVFRIFIFIALLLFYILLCFAKTEGFFKIFDSDLRNWVEKYLEQRADTESFKNLDCYECVKEARYLLNTDDEKEKNSGYLSVNRIKEIRRKFKNENRVCDVHKNIKERRKIEVCKQDKNWKPKKVLTFDIYSKKCV